MKTIGIRELHLETGRWVRRAAAGELVIVTDHGRRIASLRPFEPLGAGKALPDREGRIGRRSRIPVDSAVLLSEMRSRS